MNNLWTIFVGYLQTGLFVLAHLYGGNMSLAIITLSAIVRFSLMPLTLRIARKSQRKQAILKTLQPELERLKKRYSKNPEKLSKKTMELYEKHGIKMIDGSGFLGSLIQLPVFAGMFSAIRQGLDSSGRFLWISDISQPNIILTLIVAAFTFAASALSTSHQEQGSVLNLILPTALTLLFIWRLSAGLGLYMATSSLVGIVQAGILRRKTMKQ
jgi:YidC/Oxa1 family membrane protein insertase